MLWKSRVATAVVSLILVVLVSGCSDDVTGTDDSDPPAPYGGITETDADGNILSLDPTDWTLDHILIGEKLLMEKTRLDHVFSVVGEVDTIPFRIVNFSTAPVNISGEGSADILRMEPATATIPAGNSLELLSIYTSVEDEVFSGTLLVESDPPGDSFAIPVKGWPVGEVTSVDPEDMSFGFGPAYPNPTADSASIPFTIQNHMMVSVVVCKSGDTIVRTLIELQEMETGSHEVLWDGLDDEGEPVPAGIYRAKILAGGDESRGDIEVIR